MKVLIAGASGFVGRSLAEFFCRSKEEVTTFDIKDQDKTLQELGAKHIKGDLSDPETVKKAVEGIDLVINSAIIQIPFIDERPHDAYKTNVKGLMNLCEAVEHTPTVKGFLHMGTWHVMGENLSGIVTENFGFFPERVEERARSYVLTKLSQESTVRLFNRFSKKNFAVLRLATVLGDGMPEKTAANIFINQAIQSKPLTPYKSSLNRLMIYISIEDVQKVAHAFAKKIIGDKLKEELIYNIAYPKPMSILELSHSIIELTKNYKETSATIQVVDDGKTAPLNNSFLIDTSKTMALAGLKKLQSPEEALDKIIQKRLQTIELVNTVKN